MLDALIHLEKKQSFGAKPAQFRSFGVDCARLASVKNVTRGGEGVRSAWSPLERKRTARQSLQPSLEARQGPLLVSVWPIILVMLGEYSSNNAWLGMY